MKIAIVLVLVSLCVLPASFTLLQSAIDFREPARFEEFKYIIKDYIANDEQTMLAAELFTGREFLIFYKSVAATPEMINLINYLHASGTRIVFLVNKIRGFLGLPAFVPKKVSNIPKYVPTTGIEGALYKILKLYPAKSLQTFIKSAQFASLEKILQKQLATDPLLAVQMLSLWTQLNSIPELKDILNYMQDYGGVPFLQWMSGKTASYGVPEFSRTTYNYTRTGGLIGLLTDILILETPQLPELITFFATATTTDMEVKKAFDLAILAGRKLMAMRTTPQYKAMQNLLVQYSIDPTAFLDFAAFILAKLMFPEPQV